MAVTWSDQAFNERERLFSTLSTVNQFAATKRDLAIKKLTDSLDGVATYAQLSNGSHYATVKGYDIVIIYDRLPNGDANILSIELSVPGNLGIRK